MDFFYGLYSTLLHLPPLRFNWVGVSWYRIQDCCDLALIARPSNHPARSHPLSTRSHPHSARSHPHSSRSHPHSASSHPQDMYSTVDSRTVSFSHLAIYLLEIAILAWCIPPPPQTKQAVLVRISVSNLSMATISLSKRSIEKNETTLKNRCASDRRIYSKRSAWLFYWNIWCFWKMFPLQ